MNTQVLVEEARPTVDADVARRRTWRRTQLCCSWCGIPMIVLLAVGMIASGYIPPHHPSDSAAEIAKTYRDNTDRIRIFLAVGFLSIGLYFPFAMAIAAQTRRVEGRGPVLVYVQVASLAASSVMLLLPWLLWFTAAFRPERAASQIQLLNDLGWIVLVTGFIPFFSWIAAAGFAILSDQQALPVYPRWLGYASLFVALSFIPDICVPFFHHGAFSWAGIFPFYLPFAWFFVWMVLMMIWTARAINEDPDLAVTAN